MSAIIHKGVLLGKDVELGEHVIIGLPPRGAAEGELRTVIGDYSIIRSHTVIYAGNVIGERFQSGHHVLIRENNTIGKDVSIGSSSVVAHHVKLGDHVRIHSQAFIPEFSVIEDDAWIGPRAVLTNAMYPKSRNVKNELKGPLIRRGAKIGANATLLPGVEIGEGSLVGAGAVVTKSVEKNAVVVGNPARKINSLENLPYE